MIVTIKVMQNRKNRKKLYWIEVMSVIYMPLLKLLRLQQRKYTFSLPDSDDLKKF